MGGTCCVCQTQFALQQLKDEMEDDHWLVCDQPEISVFVVEMSENRTDVLKQRHNVRGFSIKDLPLKVVLNIEGTAGEVVELLGQGVLDAASGNGRGAIRKVSSDEPLKVLIKNALHLRNADWSLSGKDLSDPYCVCEVDARPSCKFVTPVVHDHLNPVWNYEGLLVGYRDGDALRFTVWDKDTLKHDDKLGVAVLRPEVFSKSGFDGQVPLTDTGSKDKSSLNISVQAREIALQVEFVAVFDVELKGGDQSAQATLVEADTDVVAVRHVKLKSMLEQAAACAVAQAAKRVCTQSPRPSRAFDAERGVLPRRIDGKAGSASSLEIRVISNGEKDTT